MDLADLVIAALAAHAWVWFWIESKVGEATVGRLRNRISRIANDVAAENILNDPPRLSARLAFAWWDGWRYRLRCVYCSAPEWIVVAWLALQWEPARPVVAMLGAYGLHIVLAALRGAPQGE